MSSFTLDYFKGIKRFEMPWHNDLLRHNGYDICAIHMKWNKTAVRYLLQPKNSYDTRHFDDELYFTILRNPSAVFESLYGYYDFSSPSLMNMDIHQYLHMLKSNNVTTNSSILYRNKNTQMGLNQQLHDMGMLERDLFNIDIIKKEIERFKREFDFVMIAEFYEESMVLLAHYLCWPLEWVTGINHNVRKPDTKVHLSEEEKSTLSRWQKGDELLYNEFRDIFQNRVKEYGLERMEKDVNALRKLNAEVTKSCVPRNNKSKAVKLNQKYVQNNSQVYGYEPGSTYIQCQLMTMGEIHFLKYLRKEQKKRYIKRKEV